MQASFKHKCYFSVKNLFEAKWIDDQYRDRKETINVVAKS